MTEKKSKKSRPLTSEKDFFCPLCNLAVVHKVRMRTDEETGKRNYAGEYLWCPNYWSRCGYWVSPYSKGGPTVAVVEGP